MPTDPLGVDPEFWNFIGRVGTRNSGIRSGRELGSRKKHMLFS